MTFTAERRVSDAVERSSHENARVGGITGAGAGSQRWPFGTESTLGSIAAMAPPTGDREFRDDVVRLASLTVNTMVLEGLTFQNCRIIGPAILVPMNTSLVHCTWEAPDLSAVFWEISPDREFVIGAIAAENCLFSSCSFVGVGVAGPPELRAMLENSMAPAEPT